MTRFFRVIGACILLVAAVVMLGALSDNPSLAVFAGIPAVALGLVLFALADVMDRVAYLEEKLGVGLHPLSSDEELPQNICPDCGHEYDFDYPKCPNCGGGNDNL